MNNQTHLSKFPAPWIGFLIAVIFLLAEFVEPKQSTSTIGYSKVEESNTLLIIIGLFGWIYWLFCVHRIHKILSEISGSTYPTTPGNAVAGHFIPFYNLYWVFKWPNQIADFLNALSPIQQMSKGGVGIAILAAIMIGRGVDGFVSLSILFAVVAYLNSKVRHILELQYSQVPPSESWQKSDFKKAEEAEEYYCSDCGSQAFVGDKFCRSCHQPLEWDTDPKSKSRETKHTENDFKESPPFEQKFATDTERAKWYGEVLGLSGKVTIQDIKDRYKNLIAKYHPDKVQHLGEEFQKIAEQKTKLINEAYDYFKKKHSFT